MEPINQRTDDDCSICAVAMVMGPPYTYERVAKDSRKYPMTDAEGRGLPWWKDYMTEEGFEIKHVELKDSKRFSDFQSLPAGSRALLVFQVHMKMGHVVAIDKDGVIDPEERPATYRSVDDFCSIFKTERWKLYSRHFWQVNNRADTEIADANSQTSRSHK
jgi:hypothetical protein